MKKALPLCLLLLAACGKDGDSSDTQAPVVAITSPTANQVFTGGQTVSITASITDNTKLKQIHLEIINTTTGLVVNHEHYPASEASYTLNKSFTVGAATGYRIKVEADDAGNNSGKAELSISAN